MGLPITFYRWPHTNIGDPRLLHASQLDADQIHAGQRHAATLELDIGGWRPELAPELLPVQNPPGNLKRPPEQGLNSRKICGSEGVAHPGTAYAHAIHLNG